MPKPKTTTTRTSKSKSKPKREREEQSKSKSRSKPEHESTPKSKSNPKSKSTAEPSFFPPPPPPDRRPPVHILTYSHQAVRGERNGKASLKGAYPQGVPYLGEIDCSHWQQPPRQLCERYSGMHPVVRAAVMKDPRAWPEIQRAVNDIRKKIYGRGEERKYGLCITIAGGAGTHRSVALGEVIKRELCRLGVRVHIRHLHRRRQPEDLKEKYLM